MAPRLLRSFFGPSSEGLAHTRWTAPNEDDQAGQLGDSPTATVPNPSVVTAPPTLGSRAHGLQRQKPVLPQCLPGLGVDPKAARWMLGIVGGARTNPASEKMAAVSLSSFPTQRRHHNKGRDTDRALERGWGAQCSPEICTKGRSDI